MNPGYRIEVFWSDDDKNWIADAPDLPMCSAHGPTPHEAVAKVEQAIQAWLDAARATGRSIPKPSSRVASPPQSPIPDDVADAQPLPTIDARRRAVSEHAGDVEQRDAGEFTLLPPGSQLERDVLGLITAAGGGLSLEQCLGSRPHRTIAG